jgi:hypothetical protein
VLLSNPLIDPGACLGPGTLPGVRQKIALLYGYLLSSLNAHSRAFQKHAPLLFGVMVQDALGVRAMLTTESIACSAEKIRVVPPGQSSRNSPSAAPSRLCLLDSSTVSVPVIARTCVCEVAYEILSSYRTNCHLRPVHLLNFVNPGAARSFNLYRGTLGLANQRARNR